MGWAYRSEFYLTKIAGGKLLPREKFVSPDFDTESEAVEWADKHILEKQAELTPLYEQLHSSDLVIEKFYK
jgi:hypothetical protein